MRTDRIYPVPIKPRTKIDRWSQWPEDVVGVLQAWNRGNAARRGAGIHHLSFRRDVWITGMRLSYGQRRYRSLSVFKCTDCSEFCETHPYGAAALDGQFLCDDCLIARARTALALLEN